MAVTDQVLANYKSFVIMVENEHRKRAARMAAEGSASTWISRGPNFSAPSELVTFYIGETDDEGAAKETKFTVHKEFVCYHSPVLDAAFNGSFQEGQSQTYHLKDIDASAFRLLVQWLYTGKFDVHSTNDLLEGDKIGDPEIDALWARQDLDLVQLWVVADKLLIRPLQNMAITKLQESWLLNPARGATTAWIPYAYEHTIKGSPLRNLAVDQCAWVLDASIFKNPEDFPPEMLLDYAFEISNSITFLAYDVPGENLRRVEKEEEEEDASYTSSQVEKDENHGSSENTDWVDEEEMELPGYDFDVEIEELTAKYDLSHLIPIRYYRCTRRHRGYLVSEQQ